MTLSLSAQEAEFVPQWAKGAVWYQIFPERFRNGDPRNDPTRESLRGADPQEMPTEWQVHPWGSDWYQLQPWEQANGEPELWKHLLRRRYGGDLQGIIDKLDYLQDLGITALYLNPIFAAPSLHKYDGICYHHVDPHLGPDPAGDWALMEKEIPHDPSTWQWTAADRLALELIRQVHARGMRIIFDGVFNHMGLRSFAFQDVLQKQQASPYRDWFIVEQWDDPTTETNEFRYQGWFGVSSLPELREDENGIVSGPREYIFAATQRWMRPQGERGIDGWRLDVAFCVDHAFWKDWRRWVKSLNPEAYLTAEIVDVPEKVQPYLQGDEFDAEMNYNLLFACTEFFATEAQWKRSAQGFAQELKKLRELYPKGVAAVNQNLLGSHDVNRIGSFLVNRNLAPFRDWGRYFQLSKAAGNPPYSPRKPGPYERQLQKLMVSFQMTYLGAPMVYYGDEVGMWGANDPDNRKPMLWADIDYEPERYLPDGRQRPPEAADTVAPDWDLFNHYRRWIALRQSQAALQYGRYEDWLADNQRALFGFRRSLEDETIWVLFNNLKEPQMLSWPQEWKTNAYRDLLNGTVIRNQGIDLPAKSARVFMALD